MRYLKLNFSLVALLVFSGCASILPGNDPVLVNGQRDIAAAHHTIDLAFKLERDNESYALKYAPGVHDAMEMLRRNVPAWEKSAWSLLETYRQNRTSENKANFLTALAVLQKAASEAQGYMAQLTPST